MLTADERCLNCFVKFYRNRSYSITFSVSYVGYSRGMTYPSYKYKLTTHTKDGVPVYIHYRNFGCNDFDDCSIRSHFSHIDRFIRSAYFTTIRDSVYLFE